MKQNSQEGKKKVYANRTFIMIINMSSLPGKAKKLCLCNMYYVLKQISFPPEMAMMKISASSPHGMDAPAHGVAVCITP